MQATEKKKQHSYEDGAQSELSGSTGRALTLLKQTP